MPASTTGSTPGNFSHAYKATNFFASGSVAARYSSRYFDNGGTRSFNVGTSSSAVLLLLRRTARIHAAWTRSRRNSTGRVFEAAASLSDDSGRTWFITFAVS